MLVYQRVRPITIPSSAAYAFLTAPSFNVQEPNRHVVSFGGLQGRNKSRNKGGNGLIEPAGNEPEERVEFGSKPMV